MKYYLLLILSLLFCSGLLAQPYVKAPATTKKVKRIIEWVRPNLKAKSAKGMVSSFDRQGNLVSYKSGIESEFVNTVYKLDEKGRVIESREGKGSDLYLTRYEYKKDRTIETRLYRGKQNRNISYFDKKGNLIEFKSYAKGLELGNAFQLKERIIYQYNKRKQLSGEKIITYAIPGSKKFSTRRKTYYYSSKNKLIKTVEYDYDDSPSIVEDYAYHPDNKLSTIITNYLKDKTVAVIEFLYKDGKIWQEISSGRGFRDVKIYNKGRLIRLRSYNNDKIYRVVDYQYEYY